MTRNQQAIVVVFVLALIVWAQQAWVPGFFHDGYLYAAMGKNALLEGRWLVPKLTETTYGAFDQHAPFVFVLEGLFFGAFGASYTTARLFPVLFALGSFGLLWSLLRKKSDAWMFFALLSFVLLPPVMKKVRFPNLDFPLMFFMLLGTYFYLKNFVENLPKYWLLSGVGFGLAMLCKGPFAFVLPAIIFFHLIYEKRFGILKSVWPWLGFVLGFGLFSLWPLALYLTDNFHIFLGYLDFTFLKTIRDARGESMPFYTYFLFLLQNAGPWLIALFVGFYLFIKKKIQDPYFSFGIIFCLVALILLSLQSFKYSHYLIFIYPCLALVTGKVLGYYADQYLERTQKVVAVLTVLTGLTLLIFPLTTEIRRDKEIFQLREITQKLPQKPERWIIVDAVYPFFSLANLNAWEGPKETHKWSLNTLVAEKENLKNEAILIHSAKIKKLQDYAAAGDLCYIARVENWNMALLLPSELWQSECKNLDRPVFVISEGQNT